MNLYQVNNKFANYGLQKYLVVAKNEESAISIASETLKKYALETKFTYNAKAYYEAGITVIDIFDHINDKNFTKYFEAACLITDIQEGSVRDYVMI